MVASFLKPTCCFPCSPLILIFWGFFLLDCSLSRKFLRPHFLVLIERFQNCHELLPGKERECIFHPRRLEKITWEDLMLLTFEVNFYGGKREKYTCIFWEKASGAANNFLHVSTSTHVMGKLEKKWFHLEKVFLTFGYIEIYGTDF